MSATVPLEFNFGSGGNLKSARRLRNLDLKKKRPTVHPIFGNTGSVVGRAYAASGGVKPGAKPGPGIARPSSPLSPVGRSVVPIPPTVANDLMEASASGGGQVIPRAAQLNPVVPSSLDQPKAMTVPSTGGGFFSNGKNVLLAGGGAIGLLVILYLVFFNKKTKHRRRKANNGKKARKR